MSEKIKKTDSEWRALLTDEEYYVLRGKGTERPYTGEYYHFEEKGIYVCAGCGNELFDSDAKYHSGSGWPSYFKPLAQDRIDEHVDHSHGMTRTEIMCSRCGGHLGHVFTDGPRPTGLRYCVNSLSMKFKPESDES